MWIKRTPRALLVGMQTGAATVESSMEISQKIKSRTSNSTSGNISKETLIQKNICTPTFIAELFTTAKIWKQPKGPSVDKILPFWTAWMDLESIILSEIS